MSSTEDYMLSDAEIGKKRIDEIHLGMVARYFRILDRFVSKEDIAAVNKRCDDGGEMLNASIKSRLMDYLMSNSRNYVERYIALRMMFDSILAGPRHLAEIDRIFGLRLTEDENE